MRPELCFLRIVLSLVTLVPSAVSAAPVFFNLILDVTTVQQGQDEPCDAALSFGCGNIPGDRHVGVFSVDSSVLQPDGNNRPAGVTNFFLRIGNVVWDQSSGLIAFRDSAQQPSQSSFDIDVQDGTITDAHGGVHFQAGDFPAADFSGAPATPGANTFIAGDIACAGLLPTCTVLSGRLTVARVTEPSVLSLAVLALVFAVAMRRRNLSA